MEFCPNFMWAELDPLAWARQREAEGWHAIAVADHLWAPTQFPHVWVTLGAMAASTSRVILTSSFANNLFRSPVEFAHASLALQRTSGGRFEAGLGAGWARDEMLRTGRPYPDAATRVSMYREAILIARELLSTGKCQLDGEFYQVDVPGIGPVSDSPPPLVASLGGPRSIREIAPLVDRVEIKGASRASRGGRLDLPLLGTVTREDVRELVGRVREVQPHAPLSFFALCAAGSGPAIEGLTKLLGDELYGGFVGEPERVAEQLRSLEELGFDRVQLSPMIPGCEEALAPHLIQPDHE
jgi:alkanesulfonate monooxygenase SsuD/methylene tetrahydromethanopterin reductase-like flavin-dependent oxidoreductase (luciferase family)